MILDTNFLIDIHTNRPAALEEAREIETSTAVRRVPQVVVFELWTAVGNGSETEENRHAFDHVLGGLPRVGLTDSIGKRAGVIEGELQAADPNDSGVDVADAVIAATALELDEPVVTDDETDFVQRIQGEAGLSELTVELYG